ncbi:MAG TPA: heavy-metal-associated domain-containing protein [Chitinophagaceae bacterium]|nr:heavy-metal-associated domain-containing protein [Chitinophagaceae bacterium]
MKNIFMLVAIFISMATKAQVMKVYLQASGLTCSICSNAINKSLKTLDFVDKIDADVKRYTFELSFKSNSSVDFGKIKRKVEDAGFSVSSFVASIDFDNVQFKSDQPVRIGGNTLLFVNLKDQALSGETMVRLVDKGFISSKEYKGNSFSKSRTDEGVYHVSL